MGLTAAFVFAPARVASRIDLPRASERESGASWTMFDVPFPQWRDTLVSDLAEQAEAPILGGYVYDSDFGALQGSSSTGAAFDMPFGEPYDTFDDCQPWLEPREPGDVGGWCREANLTPDFDRLRRTLETRYVLAEETVWDILNALGMPTAMTGPNR